MPSTALARNPRDTTKEFLARGVLLRGQTTRADLTRETGYSAASVSNHTRWLLKHQFLKSRAVRVRNVKRPVDELRINGDRGTALAIQMDRHAVTCEALALDSAVLAEVTRPVAEPTQRGVLAALTEVVEHAHDWLAAHGRTTDLAGLSVNGTVAAEDGMIFGIDGIEHWRPCQPRLMLPGLSFLKVLHLWTRVMAKMRGFATRYHREDRTCYVEYIGHSFHLSTMRKNEVFFGKHGSTSAFLHQSVMAEGPICFCGRRGCLADMMASGRVDMQLLGQAFITFLRRIEVDTVGLEWEIERPALVRLLEREGFEVITVDDSAALANQGLRILTAQAAMVRALAAAENHSD